MGTEPQISPERQFSDLLAGPYNHADLDLAGEEFIQNSAQKAELYAAIAQVITETWKQVQIFILESGEQAYGLTTDVEWSIGPNRSVAYHARFFSKEEMKDILRQEATFREIALTMQGYISSMMCNCFSIAETTSTIFHSNPTENGFLRMSQALSETTIPRLAQLHEGDRLITQGINTATFIYRNFTVVAVELLRQNEIVLNEAEFEKFLERCLHFPLVVVRQHISGLEQLQSLADDSPSGTHSSQAFLSPNNFEIYQDAKGFGLRLSRVGIETLRSNKLKTLFTDPRHGCPILQAKFFQGEVEKGLIGEFHPWMVNIYARLVGSVMFERLYGSPGQ